MWFAERQPGLAIGHPTAVQERVEAVSQVLRNPPHAGVVRQPPKREDGKVTSRHDIYVVPRPPELDERGGFPTGCPGSPDARMDREERRPGHAILQTGPRCPRQGAHPAGEPLVKSADAPSEREDLRPSKDQARTGHVSPRRERTRSRSLGALCHVNDPGPPSLRLQIPSTNLEITRRIVHSQKKPRIGTMESARQVRRLEINPVFRTVIFQLLFFAFLLIPIEDTDRTPVLQMIMHDAEYD